MPDGVPTYHPCQAFRDGRQTQYELCVALGRLCDECGREFALRAFRLRQARLAEADARRRVRDLAQTNVRRPRA